MKFHKLGAALIVASCAMALPALGCYGTESGYVAYDEPPPPREEVVVSRPGYFWIHGHWDRDGGRWRWLGGHYERERAGYGYTEGRWENHDGRYRWREGGWRARGGIVIREHRD